jgi:hypothetical protein
MSQFAEWADRDLAQSERHVVTAFGSFNLGFPGKCIKEGFQIARGSMLKAEG